MTTALLSEPLSTRALTAQLAEDLAWLEEHCRADAELAVELRLAVALVRNCVGPFLEGQPPSPLHVVVVGGAGAGKSTVANLLSGAEAAESNAQAGFTRHPVAYTTENRPLGWTGYLGFLGPLQRLPEPRPSSLDSDVYQIRRVRLEPSSDGLLRDWIVWDCPDMTTWAATGYVPRLMEVAALADVIVYVASDERYNDEVPTQFLRLLLQTGKPVVTVLTKMRERDAATLLAHYQQEVVSRLPPGVAACLPLPYLSPAALADPVNGTARYRVPLLQQVTELGNPADQARRRVVYGAMRFLSAAHDRLLAGARVDVQALEDWQKVVETGRAEFEERYRREYLQTEKFRRFDESLVKLLDLLELPGVGRVLSNTLWVVRTPYRWLRGWVAQTFSRPDAPAMPEQPVLEQALAGWLDMLHKEAARRCDLHPIWRHLAEGFNAGLGEQTRGQLQQGFRSFQVGLADEVDRTARALYEDLEKSPALLNTLRGGKFALDVAAIGGGIALGGQLWIDAVLVLVGTSLTQQLVEFFGQQYVDGQREQARLRQQELMSRHIAGPVAEWLTRWPASGGTSFERLLLALKRVPESLHQLDDAVTRKLAGE